MIRRWTVTALILAVGACVWLGACTNDPFDPSTLPNQPPVMSFFVEPVDPDGELNPTSYFERTFRWSGSDPDGMVTEYHVSIRTTPDDPAPWDTTAVTDTTMNFITDDDGQAEATFYLACRDDKGAMSDTLITYVPLQNFPPALNFQSDFEPLVNLQREFILEGETVVDTTYWNWGAMNARLFAFDLDGNSTMDDFYRYTCADTDPTEVKDWDDPEADPMLHWLQAPFEGTSDILDFEVFVSGLPAGQRTLTVAVADEADAVTRFTYSWEVRAPRGPMLVIPDNSGTSTRLFYRNFLAEYFGEDGWDEYDFWYGMPDNDLVLVESMRQFEAVFWFDGGGTSSILEACSQRDGPIETYTNPSTDDDPGRFMIISKNLTGASTGLSAYFIRNVMGVNTAGRPVTAMVPSNLALDAEALGTADWLPPLVVDSRRGRGMGLDPLVGTEILYQFPECIRCFGSRDPWDPIIGVRVPARDVDALANTLGLSFQLEYLEEEGVYQALSGIFEYELGVPSP